LNSQNLSHGFEWLESVISGSIKFDQKLTMQNDIKQFRLKDNEGLFASFMIAYEPSTEELCVLLLALVPHVIPEYFNEIITEYFPEGSDFPEFGGARVNNHRGILPTGETAQFIIGGNDIKKRIEVQSLFRSDHWFCKDHILWLDPVPEGEPVMSGRLILDNEIVELLTVGSVSKPRFTINFPAECIETMMEWDDLVLNPNTRKQISEIEKWIKYNDKLLQIPGLKKKVKPGYRALFYGPPGTGKTLAATLLGKYTGKDVFRIDLSRVVSKYIGETEKNLSRLFDKAENKNWILFFDEADALFGKRTDIRDAHDKYANQEVSFLLQRIENYNGLVILATNQRGNIDDSLVRRFQAVIHFPMPRPDERYEIWKKTIPEEIEIANDIDLKDMALRYELSGAGILNVVHYCSVEALATQSSRFELNHLEKGIMREFVKEGKIV
jgi:hypothetical protein